MGCPPSGSPTNSGSPRSKAAEFIDNYFSRFSQVTSFMEGIIRGAKESGQVTTLLGRRRLIPEIHSSNGTVRQGAERIAVNTVIQGSAADIMKQAMLNISHAIHHAGLSSRLLLQVHDELIFEVPLEEVDQMKLLVRETMEHAYPLSIPMRVSIETGRIVGRDALKVIGLTGRYCAGKSSIAKALVERGMVEIDVDALGHTALNDSVDELRTVFSDAVIDDSGKRRPQGFSVRSSLVMRVSCVDWRLLCIPGWWNR